MQSKRKQQLPEIDDYLEQDELVYFYLQNELLLKVEYRELGPTYTLDKARELMSQGKSLDDLNFRFTKRDLRKDNKRVQIQFDDEAKHRVGEVRQITKGESRI